MLPVIKPFSADEVALLPPNHAARSNPSLLVERSEWRAIEMPPFGSVENREEVIFDGAEPKAAAVSA